MIAAQTPEVRDRALGSSQYSRNGEVGSGGIGWLIQLVREGKVSQLGFNGYLNRFTAQASVILPLLTNGPPPHRGPGIIGDDYVLPPNWVGEVSFHADRIAACPSDQLLTIDAWDLS